MSEQEQAVNAVVVIEFELTGDQTFQTMLEALREAMHNGIVEPKAVHGAIREAADRVMDALAAPDQAASDGGKS